MDKESFDIFRKEALKTGRMSKEDLKVDNSELLEKLGLIDEDKLKRAAVLLFPRNPEKWITGAFIKIGKFGKGSDLQYQDEIRGSLILQADRVIDLIYLKYLKAAISYKKEIRIETYPFPREAVFNAILHKYYPSSVPIQIRIEDNAMYISNDCVFPSDWTKDILMNRHASIPYNPNLANTFFRAGYVETWGRGVQKICESCNKFGIPLPEYEIYPEYITFCLKTVNYKKTNDTLNDTLITKVLKILSDNPNVTQKVIAERMDISIITVKRMVKFLSDKKIIERVGSKKKGYWIIKKNEMLDK